MSPLRQPSKWKQTTEEGNWVYAAAYPKEGVVVLTMDDYYARLTPAEARAYAGHLTEAADYLEGRAR